jgi:hypothetical protein
MITKYPHIFIGLIILISPFLFTGVLIGGTVFFIGDLDVDNIEYSYDYLYNSTESTLVVYPSYTYWANEQNSLVDIGDEDWCDGCESYTAKHVQFTVTNGGFSDVGGSVGIIGDQYFAYVTDYYLDHNGTSIKMEDYDKVILMRNVYVTENFRNMVLNHTNVLYMFPDALTKKVITNSTYMKASGSSDITMTYVKDIKPLHPMSLEWADDNRCEDWEFIKVVNGYMMNCTPDIAIINNHDMILAMRDTSTNSAHQGFQNFTASNGSCVYDKFDSWIVGPRMVESSNCFLRSELTTDFNNGTDSE